MSYLFDIANSQRRIGEQVGDRPTITRIGYNFDNHRCVYDFLRVIYRIKWITHDVGLQ